MTYKPQIAKSPVHVICQFMSYDMSLHDIKHVKNILNDILHEIGQELI